MAHGHGSVSTAFPPDEIRAILAQSLAPLPLDGRRVLVIIPDATRSAPIPLMFQLLYEQLGPRVARLDYLIALGTHAPMLPEAIDRLVGVGETERTASFPNVAVYNHGWRDPNNIVEVGTISSSEIAELSDGLVAVATPVRINRMIFDYDQIIICGPVFPHEVVGFSGGQGHV